MAPLGLDDARDLVPAIRLGDDGTYELTNAGAVESIARKAGGGLRPPGKYCATPEEKCRPFRALEGRERGIQRGRPTGRELRISRSADREVIISIEVVARDVELRRSALRHREVKGPRRCLCHPGWIVYVALLLYSYAQYR